MKFRIFPLWHIERDPTRCGCGRNKCNRIGKHPKVRWRQWEDVEFGEAGACGIRTGDGLVVIDLDLRVSEEGVVEKNGFESFRQLIEAHQGELPDTLVVHTPTGGHHIYFTVPDGVRVQNRVDLVLGVDVRGEGGFVVGPGSPHKNGGIYVAEDEETPIAEIPGWLLKLLPPPVEKLVTEHRTVDPDSPEGIRAVAWAREYLTKAEPSIEGQDGSGRLFAACCRLVSSALPLETLEDLVNEVYNPRCEPPWSSAEIAHKIDDADGRVTEPRGLLPENFSNRMMNLVPPDQVVPQEPNPEHEYTYEAGMRTVEEGRRAAYGEVVADLFHHVKWSGVLAYDSFHARVFATNPPMRLDAETSSGLSDTDIDLIRAWFEYHGKRLKKEDVRSAIEIVARRRTFNPVQDYLRDRGAKWDGIERLTRVLPDYFMTTDGPYELAIGPRWFISMVARAMCPGCQADCTLILEGPQGIGKTSAFRALMHDPTWYAESSAGVDSKDFYENLRGVWLMGFDELDSLTRRSLTRVKTVLTSVQDKYRKSYGHYSESHPRACGFCGSTNELEYFNDPTGNRRLWPVVVLKPIDIQKIIRDRDQIWAEAFVRWQSGEEWHVNTPELKELCEEEQEKRLEIDAWEEAIREWLSDPTKVSRKPLNGSSDSMFKGGMRPYDASKGVTVSAALERAVGKLKGQWSVNDAHRVGRIFRHLGLEKERIRVDGMREWRFNLPEIEEKPEELPTERNRFEN